MNCGELPNAQAKLINSLTTKRSCWFGESKPRKLMSCIIAATYRDLHEGFRRRAIQRISTLSSLRLVLIYLPFKRAR